MARLHGINAELIRWRDFIRDRAVAVGLDFFEVIFETVEPQEINEIAALGGFPQRYPHWRFGMEYDKLSKSHTYGLSKIYELVINTDPCYAYLLSSNSLLDQKLVMAHVYGHSDFFKSNKYFEHTNRRMLDVMANNSTKIRGFQERYGVDVVEEFMDKCLSLDNLIDYHSPVIRRLPDKNKSENEKKLEKDAFVQPATKSYMSKFVQAPVQVSAPTVEMPTAEKALPYPERDALLFLLKHAPLESWQQECLSVIRDEAYYFAPQGQTKIMNEGWASYWHTTLLTQHGIMNDSEVINYADVHSGTMYTPPGGLNPYKIGIELFRDIEDRWNKGQFGKDWEECDDHKLKTQWNLSSGLGKQKIFEVRKLYSDVTFIDTFLTEDFCRKNKLFMFAFNNKTDRYEIDSRDFKKVKEQLLAQLTNFGQPLIEVVDANYGNRSELLFQHRFDGKDLRPDYAEQTLRNICSIWKRPVHIETTVEGKKKLLSFDGKEYYEK